MISKRNERLLHDSQTLMTQIAKNLTIILMFKGAMILNLN